MIKCKGILSWKFWFLGALSYLFSEIKNRIRTNLSMQIFSTCGTRTWSNRMIVCSGSLLFHCHTHSLDGTHWFVFSTLAFACSATRMPPFCTANKFLLLLSIFIYLLCHLYWLFRVRKSVRNEILSLFLLLTGTTEFLVAFIDSSAMSVLLSERLPIDLPISMLADGLNGCADSFSVIFSIPAINAFEFIIYES